MAKVDLQRSYVPAPAALQNIPWDVLRPYLVKLVWALYDEHKNETIFTVRKWFISISIRVEQVRPLLEAWFGPHP